MFPIVFDNFMLTCTYVKHYMFNICNKELMRKLKKWKKMFIN